MVGGNRVVILGGGFGGLYCAQSFRRAPVQVTLVDRRKRFPARKKPGLGKVSPAELDAGPQLVANLPRVADPFTPPVA